MERNARIYSQSFLSRNETTTNALLLIFEEIEKCYSLIEQTKYNQPISIDIISSIFKEKLNYQKSHLQIFSRKSEFLYFITNASYSI